MAACVGEGDMKKCTSRQKAVCRLPAAHFGNLRLQAFCRAPHPDPGTILHQRGP
jgi:hypothetical protein